MSTEQSIIKAAILNEQEGYQFYIAASERATNPEAKQAFKQFAEEEKMHEAMLRQMFTELRTTGRFAVYDTDGGNVLQPRIFRRGTTLIDDDYELAAYRVAILLEEAAMRFYSDSAERTASPAVKKMLLDLAQWETEHRDALQTVYEQLRQAWWKKEAL